MKFLTTVNAFHYLGFLSVYIALQTCLLMKTKLVLKVCTLQFLLGNTVHWLAYTTLVAHYSARNFGRKSLLFVYFHIVSDELKIPISAATEYCTYIIAFILATANRMAKKGTDNPYFSSHS